MSKLPRWLRWLQRVTPLRIAMIIAVAFCSVHFMIESDLFENGPLSKRGLIQLLDLKALDLKFQNRSVENLPEARVVIAAIDEKSVEAYGLWPWSRKVIANFIDAATAGGAKVIGFDAVFADEDKSSSYATFKSFSEKYNAKVKKDKEYAVSPQNVLHAASEASLSALSSVAALEQQLSRRRGDKAALSQTVDQVKRNAQRVALLLSDAKKSGLVHDTDGDDFYRFVQHEIEHLSPDETLAKSIEQSDVTILGFFNFYSPQEIVGISKNEIIKDFNSLDAAAITHLYEHVIQDAGGREIDVLQPAEKASISNLEIRPIVAAQAPLSKFAEKAKHFGYFNVPPDLDGAMRRIRLLNRFDAQLYPALSLSAATLYLGGEIRPINGTIKPGRSLDGISLAPGVEVPTDLNARMLINYYTDPQKYFPTYSVVDIVNGTVPASAYKDKVVLFGMTAQGLYDLRPTPFSPTTPGVYVHASAIQNIIDGRYLERYYGLALFEIALYLLLGLVMGWGLPRMPAWAGVIATLVFAVVLYELDTTFLFARGIWMLTVLPMLQATVTFLGITLHGYLTEGREKRKIRKAFQYYLSSSVVEEMLKDTDKLQLGGERRVCTVLFSDIRGFTTISEKLSPEELVSLLNSYLTPMTNIVFKYDGTLDKYMGDAIMAIFGAPVAYEDHAARACYACLDMMSELKELQKGWQALGLPELDIGIGLNTGPMSVGNMGSTVRFDYTAMGDNVNLGSRLEGTNKQYGTHIIISEYTYAAAGSAVYARELDCVRVKGKHEPVRIYELLGRGTVPASEKEFIDTFEKAIGLYKAQQWDAAIALFETVRSSLKKEDGPSIMYIERCEHMRVSPPAADWDGVYVMKTK